MQFSTEKLICRSFLVCCLVHSIGCGQDDTEPKQIPQIPIPSTPIPAPPATTTDTSADIDYQSLYTSLPPLDEDWITFGSFKSPRPADWIWIPPSSNEVTSNYVLSGVSVGEQGKFTIFLFNPGEDGEFEANLKRWNALFSTYEGGPVNPKVDALFINGKEASIVEFRGEYIGSGATWHLHDHTLLLVTMKEKTKTILFKLLGPTETINANRDTLHTFLNGIQPLSPLP